MLVNLRALLVRLIDIVLLRGGPEQLPASSGLLAVVVAVYVGVSALTYSSISNAPNEWPTMMLVETLVLFFGLRAAIALANKRERFLQAATAFFAVSALFMPALLPMSATLLPYAVKPDPAMPPPAGLTLLATIIGVWLITVQVRSLRAAFEWHWVASLLFYFALNFAAAVVYVALFAVPPNAS
jgi:hypothetical protein